MYFGVYYPPIMARRGGQPITGHLRAAGPQAWGGLEQATGRGLLGTKVGCPGLSLPQASGLEAGLPCTLCGGPRGSGLAQRSWPGRWGSWAGLGPCGVGVPDRPTGQGQAEAQHRLHFESPKFGRKCPGQGFGGHLCSSHPHEHHHERSRGRRPTLCHSGGTAASLRGQVGTEKPENKAQIQPWQIHPGQLQRFTNPQGGRPGPPTHTP